MQKRGLIQLHTSQTGAENGSKNQKGGLKMPKVYGYARVSHADSFDRGISLGTQEQTILDHFQRKISPNNPDMEWGGLFCDPVVSAYKKPLAKRPQGAILNHVLKKGDVVIFARLDRAFRSMLDFCLTSKAWTEKGVRFIFCDQGWDTDTAMGKMVLNILASFAEFQSAMIAERTKEGLARKKQMGGKLGGAVAKGFKSTYSNTMRTKIVVLDPSQQFACLQCLAITREHPEWGCFKIADELEERLAAYEGRKSFKGIRSRYRYSVDSVWDMVEVGKQWEEILKNEENPGRPDEGK